MPEQKTPSDLVYCFLDTNALLHSRTFDEIDWQALTGGKRVCLALAPVVLGELDRHKNEQRNDRIKERARTILARLKPYLFDDRMSDGVPVPIRDGLELLYLIHRPAIAWDEFGLDRTYADDELIASIIEFKQRHPDARSCFASRDTGCQIKAKTRGIELIDEDRIPPLDLPSADAAEIQKLRQQLADVQQRKPKLVFGFWEDDAIQERVERQRGAPRGTYLLDGEITKRVAQAREEVNEIVAHGRVLRDTPVVDEYVRKSEQYIEQLECALRMQRSYEGGPVCHLAFALENVGASPATDVILDLVFPMGSFVVSSSDMNSEFSGKVLIPDKPPEAEWMREVRRRKASNATVHALDSLDMFASSRGIVPLIRPSQLPASPSGPRGPLYDFDGDRRTVQYLYPKLYQGYSWPMTPVVVYLPPETPGGFHIKATYRADEYPDVQTKTLHACLIPFEVSEPAATPFPDAD